MTDLHAFDMSQYQRIIANEGGRIRGSWEVCPPSNADDRHRDTWITPLDVTIWDETRSSGRVFYSGDMTLLVRDGEVKLSWCASNKETEVRDVWPHIEAVALALAAEFPVWKNYKPGDADAAMAALDTKGPEA